MGQHFLNDVKHHLEWCQGASTRWRGIILVLDQQEHNCLTSREYFKMQEVLLRHSILTSVK